MQRDQSISERDILAYADRLDSTQDIEDALDGTACLFCGSHRGPMMPVGIGPRGQVFAHREERECDAV